MPQIQSTINVSIQLTGAAFTAILIVSVILMSRTRLMRPESYRQYVVGFALVIVYLVGDAVGVAHDGQTDAHAVFATHAGNMAAFLALPSLVLTVSRYILLVLQDKRLERRLHIISAFFSDAAVLMVLSGRWTHWVYIIDSANVYHRGPGFVLFVLLTCAPGVAAFYAVVARWKHLRKGARFATLALILFPAAMVPPMLKYYGIPLMQMALMLDMMFGFVMVSVEELRGIRRQQQEMEQERLRLVTAQLKPHFLSNALLSISGAPDMPQDARDALNAFARYLRHNLSVLESDEPVPIAEELEQTGSYLMLEKRRFGDRLNYEIGPAAAVFRVPPLSVQTLAENAVRHGIIRGKGQGTVTITTGQQGSEAFVCVADDGAGFDPESLENQQGQHFGLKCTRDRVKAMCGGRLELDSRPGEGTRVTLWIPLEKKEA